MTEQEQHYKGMMRRIYAMLPVLGAAGAVFLFARKGAGDGAGFLIGSAISWLNFNWLHKLVDSLGSDAKPRRTNRLAVLMGLRYLLFGLGAYAIISYFRINPISLLAGLLIVVAAALLEILYELIYARA